MGERAYEQARICDGRPAAGSELTEDYNPLEAGLQSAISLTKVDSLPHVGRIFVDVCTAYLQSTEAQYHPGPRSLPDSPITGSACQDAHSLISNCHMLNGSVAGMLRGG